MHRIYRTATLTALLLLAAVLPAIAADGVVNVNTAGLDELMLLPRVGATVAQRIVDFREQNGSFKAAEDLLLVKGIGDRTYALMEPHVAISGDTTLTEKVRVARTSEDGD